MTIPKSSMTNHFFFYFILIRWGSFTYTTIEVTAAPTTSPSYEVSYYVSMHTTVLLFDRTKTNRNDNSLGFSHPCQFSHHSQHIHHLLLSPPHQINPHQVHSLQLQQCHPHQHIHPYHFSLLDQLSHHLSQPKNLPMCLQHLHNHLLNPLCNRQVNLQALQSQV